jgi:quinol monooxygenase YgiN
MYGLVNKLIAAPGKREALLEILVDASGGMPGCLSYVVARDAGDENAIWVTEVWQSQADHEQSLMRPEVKAAIEKGRPFVAGFDVRAVTAPVGGHGLSAA